MSNFHIILNEPEIPANTGNIIRLCANTGSELHLVHPLGFRLDHKNLRRAGLDYHDLTQVTEHVNFEACQNVLKTNRIFAIETCGTRTYEQVQFQSGDAFLFGSETSGLPKHILDDIDSNNILRIPMQPNIRSINLSNSVAIVLYEAWRQNLFHSSAKAI